MLGQLVTGIGHGAYGLGQRQTWKNHICRSKARDKPPSFMRGFMTYTESRFLRSEEHEQENEGYKS